MTSEEQQLHNDCVEWKGRLTRIRYVVQPMHEYYSGGKIEGPFTKLEPSLATNIPSVVHFLPLCMVDDIDLLNFVACNQRKYFGAMWSYWFPQYLKDRIAACPAEEQASITLRIKHAYLDGLATQIAKHSNDKAQLRIVLLKVWKSWFSNMMDMEKQEKQLPRMLVRTATATSEASEASVDLSLPSSDVEVASDHFDSTNAALSGIGPSAGHCVYPCLPRHIRNSYHRV